MSIVKGFWGIVVVVNVLEAGIVGGFEGTVVVVEVGIVESIQGTTVAVVCRLREKERIIITIITASNNKLSYLQVRPQ